MATAMTEPAESVGELRDRCTELRQLERQLREKLDIVCAERARAMTALKEAAGRDMDLRPLGAGRPAPKKVPASIALERVRDAVCTLKHFTISELAAELGCTGAMAKRQLARVPELHRLDGSVGGKAMFAYIEPEGPGAAFEADRRLKVVGHTDRALPGEIKQTLIGMISDKEIKRVVREAIADGWKLEHSGGKHPARLVKGGAVVGLASSPTNSDGAARAIRRQLRQAS